MDREELLAVKAEEIKKEIESWARENNVLTVGEQIVFTLRVAPVEIVRHSRDGKLPYAEMHADHFFSVETLAELGVLKLLRVRACHLPRYAIGESWDSAKELPLREFLAQYPRSKLLRPRIMNIGKRTKGAVVDAVHRAGFQEW